MFKENFIKICNDRGTPPTTVCQKIGLSAAAFSKWTDTSVPRKATLYKLADFLDVTVEDLLADPENVTFISYKSTEKPNFKIKEPEKVWGSDFSKLKDEPKPDLYTMENKVHMIPLFESVSAGFGALAANEVQDYVPLCFSSPIEASQTIFIKVQGDSMSPTIENGDMIQVHKQESVDSGSIAVVLLDGDDGLVKRVIYGDNWVELRSINPMYKPMRFNGSDVERIRVVGLVKKIIKEV